MSLLLARASKATPVTLVHYYIFHFKRLFAAMIESTPSSPGASVFHEAMSPSTASSKSRSRVARSSLASSSTTSKTTVSPGGRTHIYASSTQTIAVRRKVKVKKTKRVMVKKRRAKKRVQMRQRKIKTTTATAHPKQVFGSRYDPENDDGRASWIAAAPSERPPTPEARATPTRIGRRTPNPNASLTFGARTPGTPSTHALDPAVKEAARLQKGGRHHRKVLLFYFSLYL